MINFKDDVVNLRFDYKGHISLGQSAAVQSAAVQDSAKILGVVEATRSGC